MRYLVKNLIWTDVLSNWVRNTFFFSQTSQLSETTSPSFRLAFSVRQFLTIRKRVIDRSHPLGRKSRFRLTLSYAGYVNCKKQHKIIAQRRMKETRVEIKSFSLLSICAGIWMAFLLSVHIFHDFKISLHFGSFIQRKKKKEKALFVCFGRSVSKKNVNPCLECN